jgi:hypothetical protein
MASLEGRKAVGEIIGTTYSTPIWKDGVWHGSDFNYNGEVNNLFIKNILDKTDVRNKLLIGTSSNHIWNIFDNSLLTNTDTIETNYNIQTNQPLYTPTFYKWNMIKNSGDAYAKPTFTNNNPIYSYTINSGYDIYNNKSYQGLYWIGNAKKGTQIYQLTTSSINSNSTLVKKKNDEFWPGFDYTSEAWSTPITDTIKLKIDIYKNQGTQGSGYLYYSDKYILNQNITSFWNFTYIKLDGLYDNYTNKVAVLDDIENDPTSVYFYLTKGIIQNMTINEESGMELRFTNFSELISDKISNSTTTTTDSIGPDKIWFPPFELD